MEIRETQRNAKRWAQRLQRVAPRHSRVEVAGSVAKGTFLRGEADVDIFILLPKSVPRTQLERAALQTVKKAFPHTRHEIKYAEHPYVRLWQEEKRIDVVPAYRIAKAAERKSAVDRSVLHTRLVQRKLRKRQVPEVLLLKKFLKANGLYGAEIRVQGFSGYLCELLVLRYGMFTRCLRAMTQWKAPMIVRWKTDASHCTAPLTVIDPVDENRNVAAAVTEENLKKTITLAKRFLARPSERFFEGPPSFADVLKKMQKKKGGAYVITLHRTPCVEDILWGQLRKLAHQLQTFLEKNDFNVLEWQMDATEKHATLALRLAEDTLPEKRWMKGPPLSLEKNVQAFKQAHRRARFRKRGNHIWAETKREAQTADRAIRKFLGNAILPSHLRKPIRIERP